MSLEIKINYHSPWARQSFGFFPSDPNKQLRLLASPASTSLQKVPTIFGVRDQSSPRTNPSVMLFDLCGKIFTNHSTPAARPAGAHAALQLPVWCGKPSTVAGYFYSLYFQPTHAHMPASIKQRAHTASAFGHVLMCKQERVCVFYVSGSVCRLAV